MLPNKQILSSINVLLIAFTFLSCSTDSSENSSATISGSVENEAVQQKANTKNIEGAVVTAARLTSNGSLEAIEGAETETNASGHFTMDMNVEAAQNIVITARKEGEEWKGFLGSKVENGQSYELKPINIESSAETEVFSRIVASGHSDIVQKADIEAVISNRIAAEVRSGTIAVKEIAAGLENSAQARVEFFQESVQDNADSKLNETYRLLADAQVQLEAKLSSSTSAEGKTEAYELFLENSVNAYISAGLTASESAKVIEMWSRVFVNSLTVVSSDVKSGAREQSSMLVAIAIDKVVRAEAEASNMAESSKEVISDAGVHLKSSIRASSGTRSEIKTAFEEYHDEVRNAMEADAAFEATVIVEIDTEINSSSGAKSTFRSSISNKLSADSVFSIYAIFYSEVDAIVQTYIDNSSEANAVAQIMIFINLAT